MATFYEIYKRVQADVRRRLASGELGEKENKELVVAVDAMVAAWRKPGKPNPALKRLTEKWEWGSKP